MSALNDCLDHLAEQPLGTVVHVNPSEIELIQRYAALGAQRVVLVIGDPDLLPAWRRLTQGRPGVEIIEAVVAPAAGRATWWRYNVPGLGGLLEAAALHDFYPRLQLEARVPVDAVGLDALLESLSITATADRPNLLVLEAPGQDATLLDSLAPSRLGVFAWVLVRGAKQGLYHGGVAEAATGKLLAARCYRSVLVKGPSEPLWPLSLMRFDADAAERAQLRNEVQALQAQIQSLTTERDAANRRGTAEQARADSLALERQAHDELAQQHLAQVESLVQTKVAVEKLLAERVAQIEPLIRARDEHATSVGQLQQQLQSQTKAQTEHAADAERRASEQAAQLAQLSSARDEQARLATEREAQLQVQSQARAAAEKLAQERLAQVESLTQARTASDKLAAERAALVEQIGKVRDEQARLAAERQKRIAQLDAELTDLTARFAMLQEELIKAEAHVELISDLLLREAVR